MPKQFIGAIVEVCRSLESDFHLSYVNFSTVSIDLNQSSADTAYEASKRGHCAYWLGIAGKRRGNGSR